MFSRNAEGTVIRPRPFPVVEDYDCSDRRGPGTEPEDVLLGFVWHADPEAKSAVCIARKLDNLVDILWNPLSIGPCNFTGQEFSYIFRVQLFEDSIKDKLVCLVVRKLISYGLERATDLGCIKNTSVARAKIHNSTSFSFQVAKNAHQD